ncbi:hypothetical protein ACTFIY_012338 [Dictyostelium cf. discoideum]
MDNCDNSSIVFIFCGQAILWKTMALEFYNGNQIFRESMDRIDNYLKINYFNGESMLNKLRSFSDDESPNKDQFLSHSVLFMFQVSLFELYKSEGVNPSIIYGVSCGEMASLYCSGALTLKSACDLLMDRANLLEVVYKKCPKGFSFFGSIGCDDFIKNYSKKYPDVEIGGRHTDSFTLFGTCNSEQFEQILKEFAENGIQTKRLNTQIPFHTSGIDCVKEDALKIKDIEFNEFSFKTPTYTSSNGKIYNENNPFNMFRSIRDCLCTKIAIEDILRTLELNGKKKVIFVELSPHPIGSPLMFEIVKTLKSTIFTTTSNFEKNPNVIALSSLNKNNNDNIHFNENLKIIKRNISLKL